MNGARALGYLSAGIRHMSKLPSMPLFPADFFADTAHISGEAAAAYLVLLGHAWLREGSLPSDDAALARLARLSRQKWSSIRLEVLPFWKPYTEPTGVRVLRQSRLFKDYQSVMEKVAITSKNGKLGNEKRWGQKSLYFNGNDVANGIAKSATGDHNQNQNQNHKSFLNNGLGQESGSVNDAGSKLVFVKSGTEQWNAWENFYRSSHGKVPPKTFKTCPEGGWSFPTEWPPRIA